MPGYRVRVENIDSPYWRARYNGARRLDRVADEPRWLSGDNGPGGP